MTSNLGTQAQVYLGISGDRPGPHLTELFGPGWGPGQAQEPLPFWQAVATACLDFWTLLGALQNATHLDRIGESLRARHCRAGVRGQSASSLLRVRVPLPSFKEDI